MRLAFLYGSDTRRQVSTTGFARTQLSAMALVSPIRPRIWVSLPLESLICRPISSSSWQNSRTCTSGASCLSTMIIVFCLLCLFLSCETARETGSFAAACSVKLQYSEVRDAMISLHETEVKRNFEFFPKKW